jgi:hypothetical protein
MNRPGRAIHRVAAGWLVVQLFAATLAAEPAPLPAVNPPAPPPLPSPAGTASPVDFFRKLLTLTPAEQKQALAARPPEAQRRILAKLREYESMRPNDRELRLRATELEWYLSPLLAAPAANRAAQLAVLPENLRPLIAGRLAEWDRLPPDAQKELLDNEATLRYFTQIGTDGNNQKETLLQDISPARRQKLEAGIAAWQTLPADQRQKMLDRFNDFFDLTPAERAATLGDLSEAERQQMDKTLRHFENLPLGQREQCIQAFSKFTRMSLAERQQFLKNAERWKLMSPDERQAWRDVVQKLPGYPPMPPGFRSLPPLPPGLKPASPALPAVHVATNGE